MSTEYTLSYPSKEVAVIQQMTKNVTYEGYKTKKMLFDEVQSNNEAKVLVIHGTGTFYSRGGDKQIMLDIVSQKTTFAQSGLHDWYFNFPLPIITAMQGHAFGGGLTEGFYGEFVFMSATSVYSAKFMKYGFTPGMGSTFLLPYYLGNAIGWEMLFTAEDYTGEDLHSRGSTVKIIEQARVVPEAINMATELAKLQKTSLRLLKSHRVSLIREQVLKTIELELAMHRETMGNEEVVNEIRHLFEVIKE